MTNERIPTVLRADAMRKPAEKMTRREKNLRKAVERVLREDDGLHPRSADTLRAALDAS